MLFVEYFYRSNFYNNANTITIEVITVESFGAMIIIIILITVITILLSHTNRIVFWKQFSVDLRYYIYFFFEIFLKCIHWKIFKITFYENILLMLSIVDSHKSILFFIFYAAFSGFIILFLTNVHFVWVYQYYIYYIYFNINAQKTFSKFNL